MINETAFSGLFHNNPHPFPAVSEFCRRHFTSCAGRPHKLCSASAQLVQSKIQRGRESAKRMMNDGMSQELIAKYTGLTAEEIEGL